MNRLVIFLYCFYLHLTFVKSTVNYNVCSRQDEFRDPQSCCLVTCVIGTLLTYDEANEVCEANEMTLLATANTDYQAAIISKLEVVFGKEISFWKNYRDQLHPSLSFVNGSLLENEERSCHEKDCIEKHWAICEYRSAEGLSSGAHDYSICAIKDDIFVGDIFIKTICLAGRKMTISEAELSCKANNMLLLSDKTLTDDAEFRRKGISHIGVNGSFWIPKESANDCKSLSLNKGRAEKVDCDMKLWTFCEVPQRKPIYNLNKCKAGKIFYENPQVSNYACIIMSPNNFYGAVEACKASNLSLMIIDNAEEEAALFYYVRSIFVTSSTLWVTRLLKHESSLQKGTISSDNEERMNDSSSKYDSCLKLLVTTKSCILYNSRCGEKMYAICSKTTKKSYSALTACSRKQDFHSSDETYLKSICEITKPETFSNAVEMCHALEMELLVIDSLETQSQLLKLIKGKAIETFWINGVRDDYSQWFSYSPEKRSIFPGLSWTAKRNAAQCLNASKVKNRIVVGAFRCSMKLNFFCEFKKSQ